jgi:hypothetical protein
MAVIQEFEYTWPDGSTPIQFHPWIETLPQAEQEEFAQALGRQQSIRDQWISNGLLEKTSTAYIWKDEQTFTTNKPTDPVWSKYWERWIKETGVKFNYSIL